MIIFLIFISQNKIAFTFHLNKFSYVVKDYPSFKPVLHEVKPKSQFHLTNNKIRSFSSCLLRYRFELVVSQVSKWEESNQKTCARGVPCEVSLVQRQWKAKFSMSPHDCTKRRW